MCGKETKTKFPLIFSGYSHLYKSKPGIAEVAQNSNMVNTSKSTVGSKKNAARFHLTNSLLFRKETLRISKTYSLVVNIKMQTIGMTDPLNLFAPLQILGWLRNFVKKFDALFDWIFKKTTKHSTRLLLH